MWYREQSTTKLLLVYLSSFSIAIVGKLQHHGSFQTLLFIHQLVSSSWCCCSKLPTQINLQFYLIWMRKELESKLDETRLGEPIIHQPHFPTKWLFLEPLWRGRKASILMVVLMAEKKGWEEDLLQLKLSMTIIIFNSKASSEKTFLSFYSPLCWKRLFMSFSFDKLKYDFFLFTSSADMERDPISF